MSDANWQVPLSKVGALRAFALDILKFWPNGDVDGGYLQEVAAKHGLLVGETHYKPCCWDCTCAKDYGFSDDDFVDGIECFNLAEWLKEEVRYASD